MVWADRGPISIGTLASPVEMHLRGAGQPVLLKSSWRGPVRCGRSFPPGIFSC